MAPAASGEPLRDGLLMVVVVVVVPVPEVERFIDIFEKGSPAERHQMKTPPEPKFRGRYRTAWRAGQRVLVLSPFCCQIRRALAMCAATDSVTGL